MTGHLTDLVGWAGAAALLLAYALVTRNPTQATGRGYLALNLAGSTGLAANGAAHTAWPSTVLNLLWLAIALIAFARRRSTTDHDAVNTSPA